MHKHYITFKYMGVITATTTWLRPCQTQQPMGPQAIRFWNIKGTYQHFYVLETSRVWKIWIARSSEKPKLFWRSAGLSCYQVLDRNVRKRTKMSYFSKDKEVQGVDLCSAPQRNPFGNLAYNELKSYRLFSPLQKKWFQPLKIPSCVRHSRIVCTAHLPCNGVNTAVPTQGGGRGPLCCWVYLFLLLAKPQLWEQPALNLGWNLQALCSQGKSTHIFSSTAYILYTLR